MKYHLDIQHACADVIPVTDETLSHWVTTLLTPYRESAELTLRLVDREEITSLNHLYRKKNKATNVLAFPATHPEDIELDYPLLGDVVICPAVLAEESQTLDTPLVAHWAHIVFHGVLHLLGYDHINESDATLMQAIEMQELAKLGFNNPYEREGYTRA